jgi:triosephosphate isomerase (TIM)
MRTPLVAANWKMYKTVQQAVAFLKEFKGLVGGLNDVEIVVAPPFTAIQASAEAVRGTNLAIAGQDVYWEREGAFTGEVSAGMLKEAGAEFVIIGHSERRTKFGESDAQVNRKVKAAIEVALTPIVCVGETLDEREGGRTLEVLDRQLRHGLEGIPPASIASLALAYEPVWAIGTGKVASTAQAQEAHEHIRGRLRGWFGVEAASACRILYGGSVKPANARELVSQPDVDGALVGGASLDVRGFVEIVAGSRPARL